MTFCEQGKRHHKIKAGFDLTPLVTVMLNLLIFFILSSTFVVQSSIQFQAPVAQGTSEFGAQDNPSWMPLLTMNGIVTWAFAS